MSIDCKATVNIGGYSRGGKTRGDRHAEDHDLGYKEKYTPFGVVDEDNAKLHILFGSSAKTSDFIVDCLGTVWDSLPQAEREACSCLQLKVDNGPESSGRRTQFLKRMVDFAGHIGKPSNCCITRRITANTTLLSDAGAYWRNIGMAPNWSMCKPCLNGQNP